MLFTDAAIQVSAETALCYGSLVLSKNRLQHEDVAALAGACILDGAADIVHSCVVVRSLQAAYNRSYRVSMFSMVAHLVGRCSTTSNKSALSI